MDIYFSQVSETAQEPPSANEEIDEFNHPLKLSIEATAINQNFSQQILLSKLEARKRVIYLYFLISIYMHVMS